MKLTHCTSRAATRHYLSTELVNSSPSYNDSRFPPGLLQIAVLCLDPVGIVFTVARLKFLVLHASTKNHVEFCPIETPSVPLSIAIASRKTCFAGVSEGTQKSKLSCGLQCCSRHLNTSQNTWTAVVGEASYLAGVGGLGGLRCEKEVRMQSCQLCSGNVGI